MVQDDADRRRGMTSSTIYFPPGLYRWLKDRAVVEQTSLTRLVARACQEYRNRAEEGASHG